MRNQSYDIDIQAKDSLGLDLFSDPPDYYPSSPLPTSETYTFTSGHTVKISLIGHSPLWGHHLWNGGRLISSYLESHVELVRGMTVLELGAGAGLPSLICAHLGAECVVVTDYPDKALIENLKQNVRSFSDEMKDSEKKGIIKSRLMVEGHCWGQDCMSLLNHLSVRDGENPGFDVLILADLLFNHSEHENLLATVKKTLRRHENAKAFVFFTPYRPWLLEKDLAFFNLVQAAGMKVEKIFEDKMEKVMFEEDHGDQELRKTVFGFIVRWEL